ncbi:ABC transporter substrate-binding protein [Alicyclobacillus herbarius]|uniref:ABC transporter substrate-binding protein n=1 Tax=Alicyclobacillus herbarius TaxID=122960 RepID=UPI000422DC07|nr:ABC transporter substrate-binding protein [Alicyclobacillus herbarius]
MQKSKFGKTFWIVAGIAATLAAAGCGTGTGQNAGGQSSGSSDKQENITFAWWTNPNRTVVTKKAVQLFEKKYPNIHVTMEYYPWSGYWTKMSTEIAGGSQPDVMQMDASYLKQYVNNGRLMDLSKVHIDTSQIGKNTVDLGRVNGKLYALTTAVNTSAWIYNPEILKKAGITFPTGNYSWDDFKNMAEEIHKKLPDVYGSQNDVWQTFALDYYTRTRGQSLYSADGKSLGLTKQTIEDWFNYWLDMQKNGGCPPAQEETSYTHSDLESSPFNKGKVAFDWMWIGEEPEFEQDLGKPIVRALLPEWGNTNKPYILHPAMYWTISSTTKYPDAAAKLVNFLENDPQVSKLFLNDRGIPANNKNLQADAKVGGEEVKKQDEFMQRVEKIAQAAPLSPPVDSNIHDALKTIAEKVLFGQISAKEGADEFYTQANQILSQGS